MHSRTLVAVAVSGLLWTAGVNADQGMPYSADETTPAMSTVHSLDARTGGYKGWGPMANLQTPHSVDESMPSEYFTEMRDHQMQLAEVERIRDQNWVANAPLRAEYENVGATRSEAGGFGGFFHRDSR